MKPSGGKPHPAAIDLDALPGVFGTPWFRSYARSKIRTDPLYEAAGAEFQDSDLPLLDVGCGIGLFTFVLRASGFGAPVVGIDIDARKIAAAQRVAATHFEAMDFRVADGADGLPDFRGNVSVLDILQYFNPVARQALLQEAVERVAPGGKLVIRNAVRDRSWRFRVNQVGDQFSRLTFWNRGPLLDYPTVTEVVSLLESSGLEGGARPLWGKTPFNNYLFVFRRPGGAGGDTEKL